MAEAPAQQAELVDAAFIGVPPPTGEDRRQQAAAMVGPSSSSATSGSPEMFIIMHSISKRHNVGTIARCATAFGVREICLVGSRQFNSWGAHGSEVHVRFGHYPTLQACVQHLKEVKKCEIIGVEIVDQALPVHTHPFTGPVALMLGNEGQGLSSKQMALCDKFVYIAQYGAGTASLNVAVATSIVLHHFAIWAGYQEQKRKGYKFVVEQVDKSRPEWQQKGVAGDPAQVHATRQQAASREQAQEAQAHADWAAQAMSALLALR